VRSASGAAPSLDGIDVVARMGPALPQPPATAIVAAGGVNNPTPMRMRADDLRPARVDAATATGWPAETPKAQALARVTARVLCGPPITFPRTFDMPRAMTGCVIAKPVQM
jgi:anhydro-N-acetylmuramic acid kinase